MSVRPTSPLVSERVCATGLTDLANLWTTGTPGFGSSHALLRAGNSNPLWCVVSGVESY